MFRPFLALFFGSTIALCAGSPAASTGKTFAPAEDLGEVLELPRNAFATVPGKDPNGWSFVLEPYAWSIGLDGQLGVGALPPVNIELDPRDILLHLEWGVFARGELRKGKWGVLADGMFAQLSTSASPPGPFYENANLQLQQGLASLALAYRVIDDRRWFVDVYVGARYNYFGVQLSASPDSGGIQSASTAAVDRIANGIGQRVDAFLTNNAGALASTVENAVGQVVSNVVLEEMADFPDDVLNSLTPAQIRKATKAINNLQNSNGAYREFLAATVQAKLAAAQNQLTSAIQSRVAQAKQNLSSALADELEEVLPTDFDGDQWWIDPIIGLRGQVNFTRWLFLAFQGDVGGFGAGSQLAWTAQATIGINFTRHLFGELGYRYYYLDYQGDYLSYKGSEGGAFAGMGVRF